MAHGIACLVFWPMAEYTQHLDLRAVQMVR
jgi:hypothetical protein